SCNALRRQNGRSLVIGSLATCCCHNAQPTHRVRLAFAVPPCLASRAARSQTKEATMPVATELQHIAIGVAKEVQRRWADVQQELRGMQARMAQMQTELQTAKLASQRALNFEFKVDGQYQCPRCWVLDGVKSNIPPIPGGDRDDRFVCRTCFCEIAVPIE